MSEQCDPVAKLQKLVSRRDYIDEFDPSVVFTITTRDGNEHIVEMTDGVGPSGDAITFDMEENRYIRVEVSDTESPMIVTGKIYGIYVGDLHAVFDSVGYRNGTVDSWVWKGNPESDSIVVEDLQIKINGEKPRLDS